MSGRRLQLEARLSCETSSVVLSPSLSHGTSRIVTAHRKQPSLYLPLPGPSLASLRLPSPPASTASTCSSLALARAREMTRRTLLTRRTTKTPPIPLSLVRPTSPAPPIPFSLTWRRSWLIIRLPPFRSPCPRFSPRAIRPSKTYPSRSRFTRLSPLFPALFRVVPRLSSRDGKSGRGGIPAIQVVPRES